MAYKVQVNNDPEEFKVIEAAIRTAVGEQLERHAHIVMEVVPTHNAILPDYEQFTARKAVRYALEIKVEVDITDVPLTIKEGK